MEEVPDKHYQCVNCGEPAAALFRSYGPSVLKLTKCESCGGVVDKYVEYDPVIVMIDLVLMSQEAQRHVLYNTEFKQFWKLVVVLMLLETYVTWRPDSVGSVVGGAVCGGLSGTRFQELLRYNYTRLQSIAEESDVSGAWWPGGCAAWRVHAEDNSDLFIWEKDFYIKFIATFTGITMFLVTTQCITRTIHHFTKRRKVSTTLLLKAFSVSGSSSLLFIPGLVWSSDSVLLTALSHQILVHLYTALMYYGVYTVIFKLNMATTVFTILLSYVIRFAVTFYVTTLIREYIV